MERFYGTIFSVLNKVSLMAIEKIPALIILALVN